MSYHVENTRVGQKTDYDKLILEVQTNGSINPQEGISLAAKVLVEHLNLFIDLTEHVSNVEIMVEKEEDQKEKVLEMTIEELDLSVRSYNCLKRAGVYIESTGKTPIGIFSVLFSSAGTYPLPLSMFMSILNLALSSKVAITKSLFNISTSTRVEDKIGRAHV